MKKNDRILPEWVEDFMSTNLNQYTYCRSRSSHCYLGGAHKAPSPTQVPYLHTEDVLKQKTPKLTTKPRAETSKVVRIKPARSVKTAKNRVRIGTRTAGTGMKSWSRTGKGIFHEEYTDFTFGSPPPTVKNTARYVFSDALTVVTSGSGGKKHLPTAQSYSTTRGSTLSGTWNYQKYSGQKLLIDYRSTGPQETGPSGGLPLPPNSSISYNKALGKLYDQLRGGVDLSIDLAEYGQTRGMLRKAMKLDSYIRSHHGALRQSGNWWLQAVYGIRPLMQDLYGSINQLSNSARNNQRLTGRAAVVERQTVRNDSGSEIEIVENYASHRTAMSVDYTASTSYLETMSRFTSLNPVSIAYETLKLSFVLDWVYDVGGYLRSMETSLISPGAVSRGWQTTTTSLRSTRTIIGTGKPDASGFKYSGTKSGSTIKNTKTRSLIASLPIPRKPAFHAELGSSRLISAAALLSQFLGVKPRTVTRTPIITSQKWDTFARSSVVKEQRKYRWNDPTI